MTIQKDIPSSHTDLETEHSRGSMVPAAVIVISNMIVFWGLLAYLVLR